MIYGDLKHIRKSSFTSALELVFAEISHTSKRRNEIQETTRDVRGSPSEQGDDLGLRSDHGADSVPY